MFDCLVASKRIHSERIVYKTGGFEILLKLQKAIQGKEGGKSTSVESNSAAHLHI
jgi:hypothetical protein